MVQIYILRSDIDPVEAVRSGQDESICGTCRHRGSDGFSGRSCYVNMGKGPLTVYRAYTRGSYGPAKLEQFRGRGVRFGAYGDPAAVPLEVWESVANAGPAFWTGYTHQWRAQHAAPYRRFLMASADTAEEREQARAMGWRVFRVRASGQPRLRGEAVCPASAEAGHKLQCADCGACDGARKGRRGDIVIQVHGIGARAFTRRAA